MRRKSKTPEKPAETPSYSDENILRILLDESTDPIFCFERDGTYRYINAAFASPFGKTPRDIIGKKIWDIFSQDEADRRFALVKRVFESGEIGTIEVRVPQPPPKKDLYYLTSAKPVFSPGGQVEMVICISKDITERKGAEEAIRQINTELEERVRLRTAQLEQSNHELESFSYSVSHDLRAPLRAIDGFTNILMEDFYDHLPPDGQQISLAILNNTRRMSQLIDDLLSFSRLNRSEMRSVPVDMYALADQAFGELTTPDTRLRITFNLQPLPWATGDPSLMRQVWLNLVSNAIKFSSHREHSRIEVGFEIQKKETIFYIRDNGAGFDMEYVDKLFGVFQRLHNLKDFEGTGVGLAIVQRIIKRHDGRVWAEGKPDNGATFFFALPVSP
jgi:PAS domain S-box-containing protein